MEQVIAWASNGTFKYSEIGRMTETLEAALCVRRKQPMRINLEEEAIMNQVELTVDGSAIGNPGPGGWCCILRCGDAERVLTGSHADTTNNRMELTAAIQGLRTLTKNSLVTVMTDSQYVVRGMTQSAAGWKTNGSIA